MPIEIVEAEDLRKRIVELDLTKSEGILSYEAARRYFIAINEEGTINGSKELYDDKGKGDKKLKVGEVPIGKRTIGIGFNMDRGEASKREWNEAFSVLSEKECPNAASRGFGMPYFIWRTEGDDKVRSSHAAREGQLFAWNGGKLPGDEFGCRCHAEFTLAGVA